MKKALVLLFLFLGCREPPTYAVREYEVKELPAIVIDSIYSPARKYDGGYIGWSDFGGQSLKTDAKYEVIFQTDEGKKIISGKNTWEKFTKGQHARLIYTYYYISIYDSKTKKLISTKLENSVIIPNPKFQEAIPIKS